jgi:uncharacterized membrane protein HdeD (DUF308 family)
MNGTTGMMTSSVDQTHNGQPFHMVNGQIVQVVQPGPNVYLNNLRKVSHLIGVLQIIAGILCIIFNAVAMGFLSSFTAHGIWGGVMFIVTGAFGVNAATSATQCKITTFMVLCIISACVGATLFGLGVANAVLGGSGLRYCAGRVYDYSYIRDKDECEALNIHIAMNSLIACLALIAGIASIRGSVVFCKVTGCCQDSPMTANSQPLQYVTMQGNPQVIIVPQQQTHPIPVQQMYGQGQSNAGYSQGYHNQAMMNGSAPPYEVNSTTPSYEKSIMHV